jgi:uncharacterized protein YlxP (DUF503 family)
MYVGALELDLLLGDVHSLKQKRSLVRPVVAELSRRFAVSAAEVGALDLHRRAVVGVAVAASSARHAGDILDSCERLVAQRPELDLLSARRRLIGPEDDYDSVDPASDDHASVGSTDDPPATSSEGSTSHG